MVPLFWTFLARFECAVWPGKLSIGSPLKKQSRRVHAVLLVTATTMGSVPVLFGRA